MTREAISAENKALETANTELNVAQEEEENLVKTLDAEREKLTQAIAEAGDEHVVSSRDIQVFTVDGSRVVDSRKDNNHEAVIYNGTRTIDIKLTEEQLSEYKLTGHFSYVPDAKAVSEHMVSMLRELRKQNGIDLPVPQVTQEALNYAKLRAEESVENKYFSHETKYDTSYRVSENGLDFRYAKSTISESPILSDEQMAYYLLNGYFADYNNASGGYGHRISILTASGDGLGNAFSGRFHVMEFMDYSKSTDTYEHSKKYWDVLMGFTYGNDSENTMYYNGKRLTFLPRTTFNYVTTITETLPNTAKEAAKKVLSDFEQSATEQVAVARQKVRTAETKLTQAKAAFSNSLAKQEEISSALEASKGRLKVLEKVVDERSSEFQIVNSRFETAKSQLKEKDQALLFVSINASNLNSAKKHLDAINENLKLLKEYAEIMSNDLEEAKSQLPSAQAKVTALTAELEVLAPQRDKLKGEYEQALVSLDKAKEVLDDLKVKTSLLNVFTNKQIDSQSFPSLPASNKEEISALPLQTQIDDNKVKKENEEVEVVQALSENVKSDKGQKAATAYVPTKIATQSPTYVQTQPAGKTVTHQSLPETGDSINLLNLIGSGLILALTGVRRKND